MEKVFNFNFSQFDSLEELSAADRLLVDEAKAMTLKSFAPYSNFCVGSAARLRSGKIIHGCNVESEVYPAGLCAERTLLFYAQSNHGDDPIEALAIASMPDEREVYPCGQCRQVLIDTERRQGSPIRVIMSGGQSATIVESATLLLPFTFTL
ncbi:MAG: cytidine deaminase [Rikenellaceae bacterium]